MLAVKQQEQVARTMQAQHLNRVKMDELERKQKAALEVQQRAGQNNLWNWGNKNQIPNKQNAAAGVNRTHSTQLPDNEESQAMRISLLKKPGIFNLLEFHANPDNMTGMKAESPPQTPDRPAESRRPAQTPKYYDGEGDVSRDQSEGEISKQQSPKTAAVKKNNRPDPDTLMQMKMVAQQNKMIQEEIERVKKANVQKAQAQRFGDEVQKLNLLEAKMYDYNKHLEGMKQLNRVGDELNKQARQQALASIKAGINRKEARERELLRPLLENAKKTKQPAQDPWARQMIEMMMMANSGKNIKIPKNLKRQMGIPDEEDSQDDEDQNTSSQTKPKNKKIGKSKKDKDFEKEKEKLQKENQDKLKKLNEELEKSKKALAEASTSKEPALNKDEIAKIIAEAFEKNKEAVEAKAKKMGIGPEDIVNLPNGVSLIKSKDPSKPPMFIMPQEPLRKALEVFSKSDSDSLKSSVLSASTEKSAAPDPMQQMMLGMLMGKNMEMMMDDGRSSTSSTSSSKSSKSSLSRTPIIINQPPPIFYPPPQDLPRLKSTKNIKASQSTIGDQEALPKIKNSNEARPNTVKRTSSLSTSSMKSSILGQPIPPPVKLPFLYENLNPQLPAPKPAAAITVERPSSLRNVDIPIQSRPESDSRS